MAAPGPGRSQGRAGSGDLATAVVDLHAPSLSWHSTYVSNDGRLNWQVAFDIDRSTARNFVLNVKEPPAPNAENLLRGLIVDRPIAGVLKQEYPIADAAVRVWTIGSTPDLTLATGGIQVSKPQPPVPSRLWHPPQASNRQSSAERARYPVTSTCHWMPRACLSLQAPFEQGVAATVTLFAQDKRPCIFDACDYQAQTMACTCRTFEGITGPIMVTVDLTSYRGQRVFIVASARCYSPRNCRGLRCPVYCYALLLDDFQIQTAGP